MAISEQATAGTQRLRFPGRIGFYRLGKREPVAQNWSHPSARRQEG